MTKPDEIKPVTDTHTTKKDPASLAAKKGSKSKPPAGVVRATNATVRKRTASTVARKTAPGKAKKSEKTSKPKKMKLLRDTFTMPENEYAQLTDLKKRCVQAGVQVKKSELLRAGLLGLLALPESAVIDAIAKLKKPEFGTGK